MRAAVWLAVALWAAAVNAAPEPDAASASEPLRLVSEHALEGIAAGNLSGLAWCGDALLAISDRDDDRLYRLAPSQDSVWRAEAEFFLAPPAPASGLAWGMRVRNQVVGLARGGALDFEALACDSAGNRYLLSESAVAVLRLAPLGQADWLALPPGLLHQARASGMLLAANAMLEGIAVDPAGDSLWLAAERDRRGLLVMHRETSAWRCRGGCILQVEGGRRPSPLDAGGNTYPRDFSDLSWHAGALFSLERLEHRICRRTARSGEVERCWSFAEVATLPERSYGTAFGSAEALVLDEQGAWVGLDNNGAVRADGERRPLVWRLAAPLGGWMAP